MFIETFTELKRESLKHTYLNSDHISHADPGGKNLRHDRTREVIVSKCRCLNLQPSGPVFLYRWQTKCLTPYNI